MTIILYFFKHIIDVFRCLAGHILFTDAIDLSEFSQHFEYKGRFVTLAAMGHGRHIGCIGLKDNTVKGHHSEGLRQVGLLKGEHTADAEYKPIELEQFPSLNLIAGKTMEYATWQVRAILFEDGNHLILRLATVNHQGQTRFHRPTDLFLESLQLLLLELTAPVIIEANFTNGDRTHWGRF